MSTARSIRSCVAALALICLTGGSAASAVPTGFPAILATQLTVESTDKIDGLGDSVTARGVLYRLRNYAGTRYVTPPTFVMRAQSGANLVTLLSAQVPSVIADAPTGVIIECENEYSTDDTATTQARLEAVIDALEAGIPGLRWIAVLAPYAGGSEMWNPPNATVQSRLAKVQAAYIAACVSRGCRYIDIHNTQQVAEARYNPSNVATGIVTPTGDGLHPSEYGNDGISDTIRTHIYWRGALPEQGPAWTLTQVANLKLFLHADSVSAVGDGNPVSTWNDQSGLGYDYTALTTQRPTYRASVSAIGAVAAVEFDGTTDVMRNLTLSTSGAQTVFLAYKLVTQVGGFGSYYSVMTLTNGATFTEVFPAYNGPRPPFMCMMDLNASPTPALFGSADIAYTDLLPVRVSCSWDGVSPQTPAGYGLRNGDYPLTKSTNAGNWTRAVTDLNSLGARLDSGGTGSQFTPVYVRAAAVFSGVVSSYDTANANWYLRRTMPSAVPYAP